jgi:c-di-GMP-binding flagellar brake protein YcgR
MVIFGIEILCVFVLAMILSTVLLEERKRQRQGMRPVRLEGYWKGDERRGSERLNVSLEVKYFINGKTANVKSMDISASGIRLTLDEKMERGTILRLEIKMPGQNRIIKASGEIVWSKEAAEEGKATKRLFNTGIKFLKLGKNDEKKLFDFIYSVKPQKP